MAVLAVSHTTREYSVRDLVLLVETGEVALPDFQRGFVWEPSQVAELLDSVGRGWPIGSLLLLEGPQPFELEPIEHGPKPDRDKVALYLLDGQQRVTSLYHAMTDSSEYVYYVELDTETSVEELEILWTPRNKFASLMKARAVVRISELAQESNDRVSSLEAKPRRKAREFRAERLLGLSNETYTLPSIVLRRSIELEALTRIFETLNRTGEKLNAFDLMVAVLRPGQFLLKRRWEDAKIDHPVLQDLKVEGVEILKLIALWKRDEDRLDATRSAKRRVSGVRQGDVLKIPAAFVQENWSRAIRAYVASIGFTKTYGGATDRSSIPSWAMQLPISYFLDQGRSWKEIESWYWLRVFQQSYAQGANTQVTFDVDRDDIHSTYEELRAAVLAAMEEQTRRGRIARLGLRGLLVRRGSLDGMSDSPLEGAIREVALDNALNGDFRMVGTDAVKNLLFCKREKLAGREVSLKALSSQGLTKDIDASDRGPRRAGFVLETLGEWL